MYRNPNELQYVADCLEAKWIKLYDDIQIIKAIVMKWN
jgi:hypothetical protein